MSGRSNDPRTLIRYGIAVAALTTALMWTLYLVRDALLVVYVSVLFGIGLAPIVRRVEERRLGAHTRLPRWAAILTIYLTVIGILIGVGLLIVPPLIEQARELWTALPDLMHRGQQWLIDRGILNRELTVREAVQQSPVGGQDAVTTVLGAIWGFVGGIFGLVTILILTFYMLLESDGLVHAFLRLFPRDERARVKEASLRVTSKVSAWLGGQLLLAAIIGSTAAIGLGLMGVPYFYVLALIAAVGEMIPVVGPVLSAIPALAVAMAVSPALALGVLVFFFVQQQFENHVLVPKVMQRQVGISPAIVITALLIGGSLLGIVGAILAVPTAAIIQVVFEEFVLSETDASGSIIDPNEPAPPA